MDTLKCTSLIDNPASLPRKAVMPEFPPGTPIAEFKPIAPTLKALEVGQSAEFPIEQLTSIQTTKHRLCKNYLRQGWDAEVVVNERSYTVVVTRTA